MDTSLREELKTIISRHQNNPKWSVWDFIGIKSITNTAVGAVGQDFIEHLCTLHNISFEVPHNREEQRANQSPWDIKIGGITFELKTATEDTHGKFQFNHIRYHRDYQAVICMGISPNDVYFNVWSKADITTGRAGTLVSMEKSGNASYKLSKSKSNLKSIAVFQEILEDFIDNFR